MGDMTAMAMGDMTAKAARNVPCLDTIKQRYKTSCRSN